MTFQCSRAGCHSCGNGTSPPGSEGAELCSCNAGYYLQDDALLPSCVACKEDQFSNKGDNTCSDCGNGYADAASGECLCNPGSAQIDGKACASCPAGTASIGGLGSSASRYAFS